MAVRTSREIAVNEFGIVDEEVLEYRWGPGWSVWDAERMTRQCAQHVEYSLQPDRTATSPVVHVGITVEPGSLIPDFLIRRARKTLIDAGTDSVGQALTPAQAGTVHVNINCPSDES